MQVSHVQDHVTHAVIGGAQMIEMGVSNSAEFFHIMSSTLYKDQILAVVREVLCNAWDAHIEAGCVDKPVEITLTSEKFVVKDYGNGIHHEDIGPIYGVYGNSTKKNDGKQTGGFGLGCKAPFAYTDHFEVISTNAGVRTIYNISKSNAQAQGKPGIIPLASFPSEESGLQVSINIKNRIDYNRFMVLVKRIVRNGDMNMTLNGEPMDKLGFDTSKSNYLITTETGLLEPDTFIMVRYGNVIYPVEPSGVIHASHRAIQNHLASLSRIGNSYRIVFQAPPHSITVQPSREGLSMQEHTFGTLKTLFDDFMVTLQGEFLQVCDKYAQEAIQEAVQEANVRDLLSTSAELPGNGKPAWVDHICDLETMAQQYMMTNYPSDVTFRKRDIAFRLREMVKGGLVHRGMAQTFLRKLQFVTQNNGHLQHERSNWLQRDVLGKLVTRLHKQGIDYTKLYVFDSNDMHAPRSYRNQDTPPIVPATKATPKHLFNTLPYLRNIIVLSRSRTNLKQRIFAEPTFRELGKMEGFLFYHLPAKKVEREAVIAFFKSTDMVVVELAAIEVDYPTRPAIPVPKKPVKKGVPCLSGVKVSNTAMHLSRIADDNVARIEDPEFMALVSLKQGEPQYSLPGFDGRGSLLVVDLFGAQGGVTNLSTVYDKYLGQGAKKMTDYVREKVLAYVKNSPGIKQYLAFEPTRAIENHLDYYDNVEMARSVYRNPAIAASFGLKVEMSEQDEQYYYLYKQIVAVHRYGNMPDDLKAVKQEFDKIPLDPANGIFLDKFKKNRLIKVINESSLVHLLNDKNAPKDLKDKAFEIFTLVLDN